MKHRMIADMDLAGTARFIRKQAGTTDLRIIARCLGIRVVEGHWRGAIDGIAMPGVIALCASDTEDEKQETLAHEIAHILLARRPSTHGDVWYLGLMFLLGLPLFERSNDGMTWAEVIGTLVDCVGEPHAENDS